MSIQKEQLEKKRRTVLIGVIIGYCAWQVPFLIGVNISSEKLSGFFVFLSLLGVGVWIYYLVRLLQFIHIVKQDKKISGSFNDEFYQFIKLKSFATAFWALLGTNVILIGIVNFIDLKSQLVITLNIFIGIISVMYSFLRYEKDSQ